MHTLPIEYWDLVPINATDDQIDDTLFTIVETTQFCCFCFTFNFYIFMIYILIEAQRRKIDELNTPFFKLCVSSSIIDMWTLLTNYFGVMFSKWGWGVRIYMFFGTFYARIYLYFAWSTGVCQAMSVSILAANRLSAMLFPSQFHKIWYGNRIWIAIFFQFSIGLAIGMATFWNPVQLYRNHNNGIVPKFTNKKLTDIYFAIGGVFLSVNCLYLILAYCYLFVVLRRRNNRQQIRIHNTTSRRKTKDRVKIREAKLFTMSTIIVGVQLLIISFFISRTVGLLDFLNADQFYLFYNALTDIYASVNPYLLWIFSDSLRKYILIRIGISKTNKRVTSITPITTMT